MTRTGSGRLISLALIAGFIAAVALAFPWFRIGGRSRSSVDFLSSASALEVIAGATKVAVIGGWLLVPVLVAVAMLVAAAGRHRLAATLVVPLSLVTVVVLAIGVVVDGVDVLWGAVVSAVFASFASGCAIMVLVARSSEV